MGQPDSHSYDFGRFRLKTAERILLREGELVPLTPKVFDILITLVENRGHVVAKDDLMKRVWPSTYVEEGNLTQNISLLRKALGETAGGFSLSRPCRAAGTGLLQTSMRHGTALVRMDPVRLPSPRRRNRFRIRTTRR